MTLLANMKGEIIDRENLFIYAPQCSFMKVGIGTQNTLKAKVVRDIFGKVFEDVEVSSIEVESGVSAQPKKKQVLEGALNRAKKSLKDNDFGVGIEAGTTEIDGRVFVIGYCVVIDKNGYLIDELFHHNLTMFLVSTTEFSKCLFLLNFSC